MNKISIITVNRNNSEGLEKTIRSVVDQTYGTFEFIVIDGASTDNSVEVIKRYTDRINYWVSEKDTGIYNAMNKAIKQATGDYYYFLNSGDIFASSDVLNAIFGKKEYTAPFINGNQINDYGSHTHTIRCLNRRLTLYDFYYGTIKHQATFIHKRMFEKYGLYDENLKIISDWKFFLLTIGLQDEQPVFVDTDIVIFEWNGISTNPETEALHKKEREQVLNEYLPQSVQDDYRNLYELNHFRFIAEKMKKNKLADKLIRGIAKIFG